MEGTIASFDQGQGIVNVKNEHDLIFGMPRKVLALQNLLSWCKIIEII